LNEWISFGEFRRQDGASNRDAAGSTVSRFAGLAVGPHAQDDQNVFCAARPLFCLLFPSDCNIEGLNAVVDPS
jgi:hypothetical protein